MPDRRQVLTGLSLLPALMTLPRIAHAMESDVYADDGVAIRGADAVCYFLDGQASYGNPDHALMWRGAVWHFTSMRNRDAFEMNPGAFAPRFGGYCAYAMAEGELLPTDPAAFTIHEGQLYLNYSMDVRERWVADMPRLIAAAEVNWPRMFAR